MTNIPIDPYYFPTTSELREMYKDVFDNKAVTELGRWTDENLNINTSHSIPSREYNTCLSI